MPPGNKADNGGDIQKPSSRPSSKPSSSRSSSGHQSDSNSSTKQGPSKKPSNQEPTSSSANTLSGPARLGPYTPGDTDKDRDISNQYWNEWADARGFQAYIAVTDKRWADMVLIDTDSIAKMEIDPDDENRSVLEHLKEYIDPTHIIIEFPKSSRRPIDEIIGLENEIRAVVNAAVSESTLEIKFLTKPLPGKRHPMWQSLKDNGFTAMSAEEKSSTCALAREEIRFLRMEHINIQKVVYDRLGWVRFGPPSVFEHPQERRPADKAQGTSARIEELPD